MFLALPCSTSYLVATANLLRHSDRFLVRLIRRIGQEFVARVDVRKGQRWYSCHRAFWMASPSRVPTWKQLYSWDGGETWEVNWIMELTKV